MFYPTADRSLWRQRTQLPAATWVNNFDIGVVKSFAFTERLRFALRVESFNTFNHPQYNINVGGLATAGSGGGASINNTLGNAELGEITGNPAVTPGRIIQLGGKLTF